MLKRTFYTFLIVLTGASAQAQQDPLFSQYMFNNLYLTPAFAGVDGVTQLTAIHRSQWLGYQSSFGDGGAPTTQMVSFTAPIFKLNSGFGTYMMNDNLGNQNNQEIQAMYAYHLGIKENKLSFGIKVGMFSQTIDGTHYRYVQSGDHLIVEGKESQIKPDLGAGLFYRSEKYYVGLGASHLLKSKFDFGYDSTRGALATHLNFTGGYYYQVNFDLTVQFSGAVRTDFNKTQIELGAIGYLKNTFWGGISLRQSEAASLLIGFTMLKDKSLKLGTATDFVLKDTAAKEHFSVEFMLSYQLPVNPGSGKKVVRTPRYRH